MKTKRNLAVSLYRGISGVSTGGGAQDPAPPSPPTHYFTLTYISGANGSITGSLVQFVYSGGNGSPVVPIADPGYHFSGWSDLSISNPRTDLNITHDITVIANFTTDPGPYTLTYIAGNNGSIVGISPQTVAYHGNGTAVTASPDPGYDFISWSDGSTANPRTDLDVSGDITVTAQFLSSGAAGSVENVLLVYNTNSANSIAVKDYYIANRPGFLGTTNVVGISVTDTEIISLASFENDIRLPIVTWLQAHPDQIYYIVMMLGVPSRISGNYSVDYKMSLAFSDMGIRLGTPYGGNLGVPYIPSAYPGTTALVTHLNMGSLAATLAYIDKLKAMYLAMATPNYLISADNAGLGGDHYYMDAAGHTAWLGNYIVENDSAALTAEGVPGARITLTALDGSHIATGTNVMGYECWGYNGGLGGDYALDGKVIFSGNSNWYLIKTMESFNGQWVTWQGNFVDWFSANAFGGVAYSKTPVGATTHVEEPYTSGVASVKYLVDWENGMKFAEAAWDSRKTPYFMAIGDPLVKR